MASLVENRPSCPDRRECGVVGLPLSLHHPLCLCLLAEVFSQDGRIAVSYRAQPGQFHFIGDGEWPMGGVRAMP